MASLPACASGVRPPQDGGSEELGVAERSLPLQVLLWSGARAVPQGGRHRRGRHGRDDSGRLGGTLLASRPSGSRRPAPLRSEDLLTVAPGWRPSPGSVSH